MEYARVPAKNRRNFIAYLANAVFRACAEECHVKNAHEVICLFAELINFLALTYEPEPEENKLLFTACLMHSFMIANYLSHSIFELTKVRAHLKGWLYLQKIIVEKNPFYVRCTTFSTQNTDIALCHLSMIENISKQLKIFLDGIHNNISHLSRAIGNSSAFVCKAHGYQQINRKARLQFRYIMIKSMVSEITDLVRVFRHKHNISDTKISQECDAIDAGEINLLSQLRQTVDISGKYQILQSLRRRISF